MILVKSVVAFREGVKEPWMTVAAKAKMRVAECFNIQDRCFGQEHARVGPFSGRLGTFNIIYSDMDILSYVNSCTRLWEESSCH